MGLSGCRDVLANEEGERHGGGADAEHHDAGTQHRNVEWHGCERRSDVGRRKREESVDEASNHPDASTKADAPNAIGHHIVLGSSPIGIRHGAETDDHEQYKFQHSKVLLSGDDLSVYKAYLLIIT